MALPTELAPTTESRVMDLAASVGVDVSDWKNWARGDKYPAMNPRYCYEWSFVAEVAPQIWTAR